MEISPNTAEDFSGHNKLSLRSWKRILRKSNNLSSPEVQPIFLHPTKRPFTASSLESPTHKKQALDCDSLSLSQSLAGSTFPPLLQHESFKP